MSAHFSGLKLPFCGIQNPKFREIHDYWQSARRGRQFPARPDFSPEGMIDKLGFVMLIDVTYDPLDFRFKLIGSEIVEHYGHEMTGKYVHQIEPKELGELLYRQYQEVVDMRCPRAHRIEVMTSARTLNYERITLPLSDDGERIDTLLAVSEYQKDFWLQINQPLAST